MTLIDISQSVGEGLAVFPGDAAFELRRTFDMARGDSCTVGAITTTLHAGTHADAPAHFLPEGESVEQLPLDAFCGAARVVERLGDLEITAEEVSAWAPERGSRLLIKTREKIDPRVFPTSFAYLEPRAAELLGEAGVLLVGLDTPSVDPPDSTSLDSHRALARGDVAILENLDLTRVAAGSFELIALPLRLEGADASPVRALLRVPVETPG